MSRRSSASQFDERAGHRTTRRKRASDTVTLGDLKAAFKEAVRPSERALAQTVSQAQVRRERRRGKAVAMPVQTPFARDARPEINFAERQTAPVETAAD